MNKILIVDDQAEIRRLLGISLRREFDVIEAVDGAEALRLVRSELPSLVLLDVMMPGTPDGLGVLDAIKGHPETAHILVAMLTARGQESDLQNALARGADAYFTKPFSPLSVWAWIRDSLNRSAPNTDFSQL